MASLALPAGVMSAACAAWLLIPSAVCLNTNDTSTLQNATEQELWQSQPSKKKKVQKASDLVQRGN